MELPEQPEGVDFVVRTSELDGFGRLLQFNERFFALNGELIEGFFFNVEVYREGGVAALLVDDAEYLLGREVARSADHDFEGRSFFHFNSG